MVKCIIIGAGPAGMSAGLYLKRAGIDVLIIEEGVPGGEMLKTNIIENYLGFSSISGGDLALKMSEQIKSFGVPIINDKVTSVIRKDQFIVKTLNSEYKADYVIVAIGREPLKLGVKGESDLLNRGVSYCATCDGAFYRDEDVAVVGGGDSALTEALYLSDICHKVYLLVRKDLRASEILINRVKNKENIIILKNTLVDEFIYSDRLNGVILNNGDKISISGLFIAIGGKPNLDFLNELSVDTNKGYIKTNEKMESSLKGLYAIGDVRDKDFYQIITAVSDGAIAALSIREES